MYPYPYENHCVRCVRCHKVLNCSRYDIATLLAHIRDEHPNIEIDFSSRSMDKSTNQRSKGSVKVNRRSNESSKRSAQRPERKGSKASSNSSKRLPPEQYCSTSSNESKKERVNQDKTNRDSANKPNCPVLNEKTKVTTKVQACNNECKNKTRTSTSAATSTATKAATANACKTPTEPIKRSQYRMYIEMWRQEDGTLYCPKCGNNKMPITKTRAQLAKENKCNFSCLLGCWPFCFIPLICPGSSASVSSGKEETDLFLYCAVCKTLLGLYNPKKNCIRPNRLYKNCE